MDQAAPAEALVLAMTAFDAWFDILVFVTAVVSAAIASVTGFGIGSLLTPTLGIAVGTKVAVAAVSVPHLLGTALRFWRLRDGVDRGVLWRFGVPSAIGTLFGGRVLALIPERQFRPIVAGILAALGVAMLVQGLRA